MLLKLLACYCRDWIVQLFVTGLPDQPSHSSNQLAILPVIPSARIRRIRRSQKAAPGVVVEGDVTFSAAF